MDISFPQTESWIGSNDTVAFTAVVDGKIIQCAITWEALEDNFKGNDEEPLECFRRNRARIEEKTAEFIERRRFGKDGRIVITSFHGY